MKVRTGFVSNSSSSSFMCVVGKEAFEQAMKELHPFVQWRIKQWSGHEKTMMGQPFLTFFGTIYTEGDWEDAMVYPNGAILDESRKEVEIPEEEDDTYMEPLSTDAAFQMLKEKIEEQGRGGEILLDYE
jgi:hypothetical protein